MAASWPSISARCTINPRFRATSTPSRFGSLIQNGPTAIGICCLAGRPSRNETVYLFRTLTARKAVVIEAAYRSEDLVRIWVNGKIAGEMSQCTPQVRTPKTWKTKFDLNAGENRLLVKHTSIHNTHGFALNIPQITGLDASDDRELQARFDSTENRLVGSDKPFASSGESVRKRNDAGAVFDSSKGATELLDGYARAIAQWLAVPPGVIERLPLAHDSARVALVRRLYDRAGTYHDALARVREFHFDVTPIPMFDPPVLKMHEALEQSHPHSPAASAYLARLADLKGQAAAAVAATDRAGPESADAVLRAAGAIDRMWAEQIRSLPPIVFIRRPASRYPAIAPYNAEDIVGSGGAFRATPSSICVFDPARPHVPARVIYNIPNGSIYDMSLAYDAKTIFFSAQTPGVEGGFQIYEIGVNGSGLKQLTTGPSSNISPVLLPNGEIMFVSTRAGTFVQCQPHRAGLLYVMNRDGTKIRKVSANIDSDHSPQVLDDGRVLFTRWDYGIEKNVYSRQALWVMNPDGTRFELFFGNTIEDPCAFWTAMPIPGRTEVVCVFGPHHEGQHGSVGLVWNYFGKEAPRGTGFRWLSREMPFQCDLSYYHGWQRPFPLHEALFLASFGGDGERRTAFTCSTTTATKSACTRTRNLAAGTRSCCIRGKHRPSSRRRPNRPSSSIATRSQPTAIRTRARPPRWPSPTSTRVFPRTSAAAKPSTSRSWNRCRNHGGAWGYGPLGVP